MKILNLLIEKSKSPNFEKMYGHERLIDSIVQFLIDNAVKGKRVKVTADCIYKGLTLPVTKIYLLPESDNPASFELDLTGTEVGNQKRYKYTVMWETNFEWVDDVTEYEQIKAQLKI